MVDHHKFTVRMYVHTYIHTCMYSVRIDGIHLTVSTRVTFQMDHAGLAPQDPRADGVLRGPAQPGRGAVPEEPHQRSVCLRGQAGHTTGTYIHACVCTACM